MQNLYELAQSIYVQEAAHGQRAPNAERCIELAGAFIKACARHEADQQKSDAQLSKEREAGGRTFGQQ